MAAVLEAKDTVAKNGSQVDEQLAQATSRIRTHDLMFGGLILVGLVLIYTTAMILLDKYVNLPEWVRQVSLAGFVATLAVVGYLTILSPLRKKINPLYAAKQVENTIDDAKNSVTGYVDAQQKGTLNATVKAALASRAAASVADADVNKAVDHRSLLYLGGVAVAFFLVLVVLFFLFRPAQFTSLVGRTFVPFSSDPIASRTQLSLIKPEPAEPTITVGQSVTVGVHVSGKVPSPDGPERVRLMIRHNPLDPNFTELPMVQGETSRDWELRVPDYLVQNGFWYKVAGGDAETPEYKVSVRSLPLFTDFQVTYEYPKYLRLKNETANDPVIRAPRGTVVTLVARTNRDVRDGVMVIEPSNTRVTYDLVFGKPDSLRFVFKVTEPGKYKLTFNSTTGERIADPFASTIIVETDREPQLVINKPEEDEIQLPANGQLAIDGKVGDDIGIDTITLKMKIVGAAERPLPDRPYLNGKETSFRRTKDNTWPTDVDYKDSVDLAQIKKDAAGLALELTADTVIEYWLEATDNCTEPKPNVGRSAAKRVRLTPPKTEEQDKQNLDAQKEQRKNEEQKHNADEQQKRDTEKREPPKNGQPQPKNDGAGGDPKKDNADPKNDGQPPKKDGEPKKGDNTGGMGGMNDTNPQKGMNDPKTDPMNPMNTDPKGPDGMGQQNTAPMPKTGDQRDIDKKADDLKNEIDKENKNGGAAKPNAAPNEQERAKPAEQKPQPPMDNMGNMAQSKPEQKPADMMNPMQKDAPPADAKPEGNVQKPGDPATPKPEAKKDPPMGGQKSTAPSEKRDEPLGGAAGNDKPEPKEPSPAPKDPNQKQDPKSGATAKPSTDKKDGEPGTPNATDKKDPAGDAGTKPKPMPEPNRGADKPNDPKAPPPPNGTEPAGKPDAGDAKPEKAPPAATPKPMPKDDMGGMNATETKPEGNANKPMPNGTGAADAKPDDKKNPPMPGNAGVEKGTEKPDPKEDKQPAGGGANNDPPKQKDLDEKQKKELEDAAKNLTNPDPKKKQDAQQKLDKAIGEDKRKELEKIAEDLQSDDKNKRDAAEQKVKEAMKNANGGKEPDKKDAPKLDEKQQKEIADAMKDLQSGDPQKKQDAQKKLDKMIGEQNRKDAEQLMEDLKSPDKDKREAAEKKLDDMKKELDKQAKKDGKDGKGKELSKEEIADLMKKAQDLQSKDEKTREKAQKELDEKIGEENRKNIEEAMKNQKLTPEQEQQMKEAMERMAKEKSKKDEEFKKNGPGSSPAAKGPMEEDLKNRLKTAELRLEEFEKKRYDEAFLKKQGFTEAEYEKFLDGYKKRVDDLRDEVKKGDATATAPMPGSVDPGRAITGGASGKVEAKTGPGSGNVGGPTVAPPGFEGVGNKFEKIINEKKK